MKIEKQVFMIKTKLNFFDQNIWHRILIREFEAVQNISGLKTWGEAEKSPLIKNFRRKFMNRPEYFPSWDMIQIFINIFYDYEVN